MPSVERTKRVSEYVFTGGSNRLFLSLGCWFIYKLSKVEGIAVVPGGGQRTGVDRELTNPILKDLAKNTMYRSRYAEKPARRGKHKLANRKEIQ